MENLFKKHERDEFAHPRPLTVDEIIDLEGLDIGKARIAVAPVGFSCDAPDYCGIAITMYQNNVVPVPLRPRSHRASVYWLDWCRRVSEPVIQDHWRHYPAHELGYLAVSQPLQLTALEPQFASTNDRRASAM